MRWDVGVKRPEVDNDAFGAVGVVIEADVEMDGSPVASRGAFSSPPPSSSSTSLLSFGLLGLAGASFF